MYVVELMEWTVNNAYAMRFLSFAVRMSKRVLGLVDRIDTTRKHVSRGERHKHDRFSEFEVPRPMNVAFICDGNRRYVKRLGLKDDFTREEGLRKIYELVDFGCTHHFGEISFFCFALKNFKRSSDEVNGLMAIVKHKGFRTEKAGFRPRFRIYGRLDLLEEDVKNELVKLESDTRKCNDITVNIFFAYSAEDEISRGITFNSHVDILIRTGGAKRLSDFMLRQVSKGTNVVFLDVLWPELTTTHLHLILLKYKLENKHLLSQ